MYQHAAINTHLCLEFHGIDEDNEGKHIICALQAAEDVPVQLWKKRNAAQRVRREYRSAAEVPQLFIASAVAPTAAISGASI